MNRHKLVNWIVYVLIFLCAGALIVLMVGDKLAADEAAAREQRWQEARQPLIARRSAIKEELLALDRAEAALTHSSAVVLLFTEPDGRVWTEAAPMLAEAGYPAMIAVSDAAFFGDAGCMTAAQAQELVERGWGLCLSVAPETDMAALQARVLAAGLPAPQAVYFPAGDSTPEAAAQAEALGIGVVINYGVSLPKATAPGMWYIPAVGALDDNLSAGFEQAVAQRTTLVMTEGWSLPRELFTADDMRISLATLDSSVAVDGLRVGTVQEIAASRGQVEAERAALAQANAARRQELTQELEAVDAQLLELDRLYRAD